MEKSERKKKTNADELTLFLENVYFDPKHPAAYGGIKRLRNAALNAGFRNASYGKIRSWLRGQEVYSLFRPARRNFPRNETPMYKTDWIWEADLMDMSSYSSYNDGYKYVLCVVDIFTRYAWTAALKSKKASEMVAALKSIMEAGRKPESALRTDKGGEFVNGEVGKLLKEFGVKHIITYNETKAGIVERLIKTLKSKLMRNIYQRSAYKWLDSLSAVTEAYNKAVHSSLGTSPSQAVQLKDDDALRLEQYLIKNPELAKSPAKSEPKAHSKRSLSRKKQKTLFKKNTVVRVSYLTTAFSREYDENFSHELFRIKRAYWRDGVPVYQLVDWNGEEIDGTFYQHEIEPAYPPKDDTYRIERVLKRRGRGAKAEALVKYYGWPKKFNTWLPASSVVDL